MNNYTFYALNILFFSLPLALFEINLEKASGWGGAFPKDKWYGQSFIKGTKLAKVLGKLTNFEAPLNYHVVIMFLFLVVFLSELLVRQDIWLVLSAFFGVNLLADIFWFSFNWHFASLTQLLKGPRGTITWHKKWTKIGRNSYLPTSYFWWLALSIILFYLPNLWR